MKVEYKNKGKQKKEKSVIQDIKIILDESDDWITITDIQNKTTRNFNTLKKAIEDMKELGVVEVIEREGITLVKIKKGE